MIQFRQNFDGKHFWLQNLWIKFNINVEQIENICQYLHMYIF